ncbi:hypothetical protein [Halorubrum vacuolatum]|uniref:hypothetical protein n=1 Tax=Halorubrum vacuolatum TaxID=63740 RepID=UPI000B78F0E4|nr:hypothetical protein [Halorubrum vacuolatum]
MSDLEELLSVREVGRVAEQRDELVETVADHAGRIAYELATLQGGDYGRREFETDAGTWTVKHEAGELEFLLFSPSTAGTGSDVYVVSTKQPPDPETLAAALSDYPNFVASWNEYVESLSGVLDAVAVEFPEPASTADAVAERDRVLEAIRETCSVIAGEVYRYENDKYGTFTARVDGDRWELKWEEGAVSYLRIGGSGGLYLLSRYDAPAATDVREYADSFPGFVRAYNEFVGDLESDLRRVEVG